MDDLETRYAAATAGDSEAIVDWEKQADLEFNYDAIYHTVTKYFVEHKEVVKKKLANKKLLFKVNGDGETALHLAAKRGQEDLTLKYGHTHEDVVDVLLDAARLLDSSRRLLDDFVWHPNHNKDTALHLALTNAHRGMAYSLIDASPPPHGHDLKNHLGETPIYLAFKLGDDDHKVVEEMCERWKDSVPLDGPDGGCTTVLHQAIIDSVYGLLEDCEDLVSKVDSEGWTPLHYAAYYDLYSILDAIHVGYKAEETCGVPKPLHVAAKEGNTSTLMKLMELLPSNSYVDADSLTGQNILHLAVLASEKEMILHILKKCPDEHIEEILDQRDVNGDTPLHLLIRDGCFVPQLIKHKKVDRTLKNKQHWTSFDMLYFNDQIIADQVKIKITLDDFQADQQRKFWQPLMFGRKSIKKKSMMPESLVPHWKLTTKDNEFMEAKKLLMRKNLIQMKEELHRYRQRTNTQIIVTALITTVTFTVGFTMPGGYHQDGELEGMAVLSNKKAFIAFMVTDALALLLSTSSLFLYFIASMYEDPHDVSRLNNASTVLNIVSVIAMTLTFITGTYVVLSHSQALAITVIVISCFFFLVVIGLWIKWRYDGKQEKMHIV